MQGHVAHGRSLLMKHRREVAWWEREHNHVIKT